MTAECDHGDDPAICPPCQGAALELPPTPPPWGPTFRASGVGTCSGCTFAIEPRDLIVGRGIGDRHEYRHVGCAKWSA